MPYRFPTPTDGPTMLAYLEVKATRDDLTGCLIWQASTINGKVPQMRFEGKPHPARRVIFQFLRGPLRPGRQVGARKGCHYLCVDPEHLVQRTKSQATKGHAVTQATRAKIAATKRGAVKLTPQAVEQIRASTEPAYRLAPKLGVDKSMVTRIRRGEAWRDFTSPFAGLLAA